MKFKDLIRFLLGIVGALFLIAVGVEGIRGNADSTNLLVAIIFIGGGGGLLLRISYRLIKKLKFWNN